MIAIIMVKIAFKLSATVFKPLPGKSHKDILHACCTVLGILKKLLQLFPKVIARHICPAEKGS
jgi:hypothetical protein